MGILTAQQHAELNRAGTSGMGHFHVMRTTDASSSNSQQKCAAVLRPGLRKTNQQFPAKVRSGFASGIA